MPMSWINLLQAVDNIIEFERQESNYYGSDYIEAKNVASYNSYS